MSEHIHNEKNLPRFAPVEGQWLVPSSDLDQYIAKVRQIPILSAAEESQLVDDLYYHKNLDSAQKLVVHHLRYVVHIARGFLGYGLPLGDLIQEGNVGLMKAIKRFEPKYGVRLVSFAVYWIKSEINEYILKNWRIVKVATTKAQRKLFFNLRSMKKRLGWLNQQEAESIASELNIPVEQIFEMESRIHGQDIALETGNDESDEDSNYRAPQNWLAVSEADPADQVEREETDKLMLGKLKSGMNILDPRSRAIIEARWLNEEKKSTLQELADQYGISAERIRQIETAAMQKLKSHILAENLKHGHAI